ncbi:MAG: TonB-dependent receptor [Acidobacteria bacterium]|nr:TonB-dependent receptor [Acidobacteriota bacterium]
MCKTLCLCFFAVLMGAMVAVAQTDRGTIAGTVKDSTNALLPGARVEVKENGRAVVSDAQGQFLIPDLPAGNYTLNTSYAGFSPTSNCVTVAPGGQIVHADVVLKIEGQSETVTVSGERGRGEVEAINIERTADNIVQVLPSKVITSLPNTNVADAVGRLPSVSLERDEGEGKYVQIRGTEPRLSNLTINGVNVPSPEGGVRNIKMDVIPSGIVDRIEVNKTLSANQDGDAIGGSVNLVTKSPAERPTLDFEEQGGYTHIIGGRWLDAFNGTYGQRVGNRKQWGFLLGGSYDWNGRGINDLEPLPGVTTFNGTNYAFFSTADLRTYKYYRSRYGVAPELDYVIKPGSSVYLKGLYSDFHDFGETWVYTPNVGSTVTSVNGPNFTFTPGSMQYRHYVRRPDQQIYSFLTGARHDLTSSYIIYEFSASRAHNIGGQDFATTHFSGPPVDLGLNLSNPLEPQFPVLDGTNIYNPATYLVSDYSLPSYSSTQLNFQGNATYGRRYSVSDHYGTFEMGIKIRNAHKVQNENDQIYNATGNFPLSQLLGSFGNPTYYDGAYRVGPLDSYGKINQLFLNHVSTGFTLDQNASILNSIPADFDANERIYAGYLMNTIGFGKFSLQTGVRFEATADDYRANQVNLNNGQYQSTTPLPGRSSYTSVLPSVQLQYRVEKNTNLRATFGMGIARPNFSDIVPAKTIDPNTTPPSIATGNPALRPTKGYNYDLLAEHYFQPLGILQAGFFYKTLTNPIYPTTTSIPFEGRTFYQTESINGPNAHIAGFETAWEQRLSFLPGLLKGFGVAANYSYTTSRITFPAGFNGGRTDHAPLQRQAPNNYNIGLTYDKARFSGRFAMSHNDASIASYFWAQSGGLNPSDPIVGLRGPNGDQYFYAHTQYDVQASYRVYRGLSIVGYGLNLSNEVFGFYQGSPQYPIQREFYHPTFSLGVRWTSAPEYQ